MREMPTAAKLIAAICFAAVGFAAASLYLPLLADNQREPYFPAATAVLGAFVGWWIMGRLVGADYRAAARHGFVTSVWLLFWALLVVSLRDMMLKSWDKRYREPTDAIGDVPYIAYDYLMLGMTLEVVGVLAIGGMLSGVITEIVSRRWR
jgi:hypothetical protein